MALIEWTDDLSVGHPTLDEQHQHLVAIINKFEEALRRGRGSRVLEPILKDLLGYTQEHFAYEEGLMEQAGFEGLKTHQGLHRQLTQKLERLQFDYAAGQRRISPVMREFLKYWLTSHILQDDLAYAECLEQPQT